MRIRTLVVRFTRNWPAKVLSLGAAIVLLVFHEVTQLEERFLSVPIEVAESPLLVPASTYPRQVRLRIRGETDPVFRLVEDDVSAVIDLARYEIAGEYRVPVEIVRREDAAFEEGIEIIPDPATVVIQLDQRTAKSVVVQPAVDGQVPAGYELERLVVTPSSVEVVGPQAIVESIGEVVTEELDLAERRDDFAERLRLVSPSPLVSFPGGAIVELRGDVTEVVAIQTFDDVAVIVTGLAGSLRVAEEIPDGSIQVQGRQLDLDAAGPEDVQLIVDASRVGGPGSIRIPVRPIVPAGFVVLRIDPPSVQLSVEIVP